MEQASLYVAMLSAFGLGLAGAGHCLGMCGGIAVALGAGDGKKTVHTAVYHLGRIVSYAILGAAAGFAASISDIAVWTIGLRYTAGFLLLAMGLYVTGWWRGMARLEQAGAKLWQPVQKFSSRFLPIRNWRHALGLGLCWGLMPCGLIYSSLAWAATTQQPLLAALLMFCFGLGTLPAMLATSMGAGKIQQLLRQRGLKIFVGVFLIAAGVWSLYLTYTHAGHLGQNSSDMHGNHSSHDAAVYSWGSPATPIC